MPNRMKKRMAVLALRQELREPMRSYYCIDTLYITDIYFIVMKTYHTLSTHLQP